ncbi:hypothetical protein GA0061100_107168 [Rhizobium hainanense]|uniref:Uncharacterized protein n=2 Tax=Rhizobium hainanense TaxID=52131 RepID=A0A1C3VPU1_9HYPH|nr:hypothetical protein GA0061100_107168 [Rhizobium hainanense]
MRRLRYGKSVTGTLLCVMAAKVAWFIGHDTRANVGEGCSLLAFPRNYDNYRLYSNDNIVVLHGIMQADALHYRQAATDDLQILMKYTISWLLTKYLNYLTKIMQFW